MRTTIDDGVKALELAEAEVMRRLGLTPRTPGDPRLRVVDVGTGSGAIAVTLAAELPGATVVATDISVGALRVARENAARHGVGGRVSFVASDGYCALKSAGAFALVVSNPPYVAESERETLPAEVVGHEPARALFSGADGLDLVTSPLVKVERPEKEIVRRYQF